jgi:menaquinone-dependent protoporphyrinogen oxidase
MSRQVLVAYATRMGSTAGATPAVTFPGRIDPMSARGFMARRLARGDLAGDFRDWDQTTRWARVLSDALSTVEMSSWTRPDTPQHNDPEGVAP